MSEPDMDRVSFLAYDDFMFVRRFYYKMQSMFGSHCRYVKAINLACYKMYDVGGRPIVVSTESKKDIITVDMFHSTRAAAKLFEGYQFSVGNKEEKHELPPFESVHSIYVSKSGIIPANAIEVTSGNWNSYCVIKEKQKVNLIFKQ